MLNTVEVYSNGEGKFFKGSVESKLIPQTLELYRAVKNHPKLSEVECLLSVELNRDYDYNSMVIFKGSLDDCLREAFLQLGSYHIFYIQLPIGETTYNLIEFVYQGAERGYIQQSFLSKDIIEQAIPTVKELISHQIKLVEDDTFTSKDILNSIMVLSENDYMERFYEDDKDFTLFEDIAKEISIAGSIMGAMEENYGVEIDISTPYKQARFKAFTRMVIWEYQDKRVLK